jgi:peptidoglycan hydrolase-like protein with peptidoglycan-binding domain
VPAPFGVRPFIAREKEGDVKQFSTGLALLVLTLAFGGAPALAANPHKASHKTAHRGLYSALTESPVKVLRPGAGYARPNGGSSRVRELQSELRELGLQPGRVDGLYGPRTERAVRRLQRRAGLEVDGVAGRRTLTAIDERWSRVRAGASSARVPAARAALGLGAGYQRPGGSDRVRELQRELRQRGFRPGPIDGLFGPRTRRAVIRFQRAESLAVDGIAGPRTLAKLGREGRALEGSGAEEREPRPASPAMPSQSRRTPIGRVPAASDRDPGESDSWLLPLIAAFWPLIVMALLLVGRSRRGDRVARRRLDARSTQTVPQTNRISIRGPVQPARSAPIAVAARAFGDDFPTLRDRGRRMAALLLLAALAFYLPWVFVSLNPEYPWIAWPFAVATAFSVAYGVLAVCNAWSRQVPVRRPVAHGLEPHVGVIVPTCGEAVPMVLRTVVSVLEQDWPVDRMTVVVSDDGHNPELAAAVAGLPVIYHAPPPRLAPGRDGAAKAGNLNSALAMLDRRHPDLVYVETRDADDEVGSNAFLREAVGQLAADDRLAFVQTIKEAQVSVGDPFNNRESMFYRGLMLSRNASNAVFPCGPGLV